MSSRKETVAKLRKEFSSVQRKATVQLLTGSLLGLATLPFIYFAMALPRSVDAIPLTLGVVGLSIATAGLLGIGAEIPLNLGFENLKKRREIIKSAKEKGFTVTGHIFKQIK